MKMDSGSEVDRELGGKHQHEILGYNIEETDWSLVAPCSEWTRDQWTNFSFVYKACGDLRPNADIAGIDVVLAFMVFSFTASLVLRRTDSMFQITALITIIACFF
jgi:hypothetical protein